ncbi:hypothetical protein ACU686_27105 [Yinghuangia aomiensis]
MGEDTASVALGAMLRAVPAEVPVFGAVETAREEDRLPLPRAEELARRRCAATRPRQTRRRCSTRCGGWSCRTGRGRHTSRGSTHDPTGAQAPCGGTRLAAAGGRDEAVLDAGEEGME